MRYLGLDLGSKRIGVSISVGRFAVPVEIILHDQGWIARVVELVAEYGVDEVIVGFPIGLHGGATRTTEQLGGLVGELRARLGVPVVEVDERLSSKQVERQLSRAGYSTRVQRGRIDDLAAAEILQRYLDRTSS